MENSGVMTKLVLTPLNDVDKLGIFPSQAVCMALAFKKPFSRCRVNGCNIEINAYCTNIICYLPVLGPFVHKRLSVSL